MSPAKKVTKRTAKAKKKVIDVEEPGKTAPSATSKPVIVTNRPILKDPMVTPEVDEAAAPVPDGSKLKHSGGPTIEPLGTPSVPDEKPGDDEAAGDEADTGSGEEPEMKAEVATTDQPAKRTAERTAKKPRPEPDDEAAEQAKRDAAVQNLIESRKYELPINAVEKRKTKRFVALGILLAVFLSLAWADIALDAGLIHISGAKPVTHFFSN